VGRQETGRSGKESAPAATATSIAKINRIDREHASISWGG